MVDWDVLIVVETLMPAVAHRTNGTDGSGILGAGL